MQAAVRVYAIDEFLFRQIIDGTLLLTAQTLWKHSMSDEMKLPASPIDAKRVARRALIMSAVACRTSIDNPQKAEEGEPIRQRIIKWISTLDVQDEIEPFETALLNAPIGSLDQRTVIRGTWLVEGLSILVWALGLSPLPKMDEKVDPYVTTDLLNFLSDDARKVVNEATLRLPAELDSCREVFYAVHCRLNDFERNRKTKDVSGWFEPHWRSLLNLENVLSPKGDLLLKGKPLADADERIFSTCTSIIVERHRAIIWLVEEQGVYSEVTVDT